MNYFIIGATSGIGSAISKKLASEGHNVFATYNTTPPKEKHPNVSYHKLDVFDTEANLGFLPEILHGFAYCPGSINILPFKRIKPEAFINDYHLQVVGAIELLQHCLSKLKKAGQASVVFFSTVAVQMGFNFHSQIASSKGAIEGLTRSLAAEFAPHIRVNAIAPSLTDTPLAAKLLNSDDKKKANAERHPLKRVGTPDDLAELASFLLTKRSSWITGQIIHADGGMSNLKT